MYESIVRILRDKGHSVCLFERTSKNIGHLKDKIQAFTKGIYSSSTKKEILDVLAFENPEVVHAHNLYPFISPSVMVACKESNVPVVMRCPNCRLVCPIGNLTRNDNVCELCSNGKEYWCVLKNCRGNIFESAGYAFRSAVARKLRLYQKNVTLYVPPSEFVKSKLVNAGFPQERIIVVPNMVSGNDSGIDMSLGDYVAYVGRISPEKGIKTLLTSARLTGIPVRLAGDYSKMPEILKTVPPNVQFVGHLNRNQLDKFYQKARFTVVPSLWFEAFGLVAAEAMRNGLPVIASRIGALPEIVEDGVTGFLFDPGNIKELMSKMKILWENKDLCREMGKAARRKAIQDYSEDVYYKRLIALYKKAIEINNEQKRHKARSL